MINAFQKSWQKRSKVRRRIIYTLFLALVLCLLVYGVFQAEINRLLLGEKGFNAEDFEEITIFYQSATGQLVPVTRHVLKQDAMPPNMAKYLVESEENELFCENKKLLPLIEGDGVPQLIVEDGVARINLLSSQINAADLGQETNLVQGIVQTLLCNLEAQHVQILIDGQSKSQLTHGTSVETFLVQQHYNFEPLQTGGGASELFPILLYYQDEISGLYVPVTRYIPQRASVELVMEEWLKGPEAEDGLCLNIPEEITLLDMSQEEERVILNFSESLYTHLENPNLYQTFFQSIFLACSQFEDIHQVEIEVEGELINICNDLQFETKYVNKLF